MNKIEILKSERDGLEIKDDIAMSSFISKPSLSDFKISILFMILFGYQEKKNLLRLIC